MANKVTKVAMPIVMALGFIIFIIITTTDGNFSFENESTYKIQLPEELNLALVNRDDLGISVALVVDISGSMYSSPSSGGERKYIQASQALTEVVNVLDRLVKNSPPNQVIKVGIILFDDTLTTLMPLRVMDSQGLADLRRITLDPNSFDPRGSTAIGDALEAGTAMLLQSGTLLRSMIVVTDGENTAGTEPNFVLSALYNNRNTATSPEFPVNTNSILVSIIGFDIGEGYFQPFTQYGARVTAAANREELTNNLVNLLEADITKLEAPAF